MPARLYTDGSNGLCIVQASPDRYLAYQLRSTKLHGLRFYQSFYPFPLHLQNDAPLSHQKFGVISSVSDLTGRMNTRVSHNGVLSSGGSHRRNLEVPEYQPVGQFSEQEMHALLEGYCPMIGCRPYGVISLVTRGVALQGDDLYKDTIIFTAGGFAMRTEISASAGRADEDCCSPDCYFRAEKVSLDGMLPPKRRTKRDMVVGALPSEWILSVGKGFTPSVTVSARDAPQAIAKFDDLVDMWFNTLLPFQ